ncbi:MAG: hypothetical protein V4506_01025, partial [Bacteroidota bacterium]
MKYFIAGLSFLVFISCKKKTQEPDPTAASQIKPGLSYSCNLEEVLTLTKNSGGYDTSFSFSGRLLNVYTSNAITASPFTSSTFNGHVADASNNFDGTILNCPNYMQLANHSTWNVISSEFGNFQYIDTIALPKVNGASITIPATFTA